LEQAKFCGLIPFGIDFKGNGLDIDQIEVICKSGAAGALYQIIYHQNPTGRSTMPQDISETARICKENDLLYICDIAYESLNYSGETDFEVDLSHPHHSNTCLAGSFTKTFTPGNKCGYGILPEDLVKRLTPLIANSRLNPDYFTQALIAESIISGKFDEFLTFERALYGQRAKFLEDRLAEQLPYSWSEITGGFFTTIRLPGVAKPDKLISAALERGLLADLAFGSIPVNCVFKYRDIAPVRLTFPSLEEKDIYAGVEILKEAYEEVRR
jgi:DNA-binding transcriptional MocR family regulator